MMKYAMIAVAAVVASMSLMVGTAEAKKGGGIVVVKPWKPWKPYLYTAYSAPLVVASVPSCGYYYSMWMKSGSFYWKNKYIACRYW